MAEVTLASLQRSLTETDPDIAKAIRDETRRQADGLELIASENFVSTAILEAVGSVMTNKYAEGYPGKRYYGGCEFVDVAEALAISRAKSLFGAQHANVQPHSGAQANMTVYLTLLKPGDTVLGMNLAHGGHLTHGHPLNFSGKLYTIVPYGVREEDERIDYEELERLAHEHKPKMIMVGASAYPRVIDFPRISRVAQAVGAPMVVDMAHIAGLVAAGVHPSPVPYADFVTSTTHKTLRGPRSGLVLSREQYAKDLDRALFPGVQGGPLMHVIAAKATCFKEAMEPAFADYQRQVVANAKRLASNLASHGYRIVSGGTDNHLMLVDVFSKGITGKAAEAALGKAGITVNKNAIPFDRNPPLTASGIRIGTPAITTRGMREAEMDDIGGMIGRVLAAPDDDHVAGMVKDEVERLCRKFPLYPRSTGLVSAVDAAFSERGALARVVEGYEPRAGQRRMAQAVAAVIEDGGTLLAEAGTGTGKTLAYLIPAILSRQRVLVSTGTKNLQEQILYKDLPALREALGVPFTATLMKGRGNYLCLHRWETYQQSEASFERAMFVPIIKEWSSQTATGDRAELRDLPEDLPLWKEINAEAETCLGGDCPRWGDCWVTRMRQRAAESDVVIVNHHLLCADASVRRGEYGEVIPSCPTLVVDEAHQLEDVATNYFGLAFSNYRADDLVRDCERLLAALPLAVREIEEIARALSRVTERSRIFFAGLSTARAVTAGGRLGESRTRYTAEGIAEHVEDGMMLAGALEGLESTLALLIPKSSEPGANPDAREAIAALQRRAGDLRDDLRFLLRAADTEFVYYVEARGRGVLLRASPIDVSRIVREVLFDRMRATILTSATLAVEGSFAYVKGRLGIRAAAEVRVASEFDYARQAVLYLPRRMPPPKAPNFPEAVARETIELVKRSRGRAFVLFTSYAVLRVVQRFVEMALPYPVLVQGTAPRSTLLEQFRTTPSAVLLATSSFWQGVDVVGDALSCVIIDKLPFAAPGDPVTSARIESIRANGGDPFSEYQVPLAVLALQQGLGRLIRHRSDRGVLAVLDPRLRTMSYGRRFLESLPPAPVTHDLDAVGRFFM